jgi:hypothetical protein
LVENRKHSTDNALIAFVVLAVGVLNGCSTGELPTAGGATASPAKVSPPATASATTAGAMIGGIAHGGYNPDFVSCELRGTVGGMVFHGTLSGLHKFDVTAGQPSNGRTPTTPTDGIFALKFAGQGPNGPFTCTLTSVDTPSGVTLAPHQTGDWTLTVT